MLYSHMNFRWRLVVHGAIDGFSRVITFLKCSNNNKASTVLGAFKNGVGEFGLPHSVRSDYGRENKDVCTYMLEKRGTNCGAFLTGKSVHNQRIERLWRDVFAVSFVCIVSCNPHMRGKIFHRPM